MSIVIHHFVVHQLSINAQQELTVIPRKSCYDVNSEIETLAQQINHSFNQKPGKGVGQFIENTESQDEFSFQQGLQSQLSDAEGFVQFSLQCCEKLKQTMVEMGTIETGYVIFSHYEFLATEYLMIALLNTKEHAQITRDMELNYSNHLDLAKMQLAVRIDLTQLRVSPEQNRYVSFIKGRMGRKVSDFFMQFMNCEEKVDVKQQNKQLIATVDEYLASEQLDKHEQQQSRQFVSDYYKNKLEEGEEIQLMELSEHLPKGESVDFATFNEQQEQPLEASFQADRSALKTLAKFSGQGGGVTISFDRVLYGDRIEYNAATDTLVIRGIPPNLKDQLTRHRQ